jgi:hypothetical protein
MRFNIVKKLGDLCKKSNLIVDKKLVIDELLNSKKDAKKIGADTLIMLIEKTILTIDISYSLYEITSSGNSKRFSEMSGQILKIFKSTEEELIGIKKDIKKLLSDNLIKNTNIESLLKEALKINQEKEKKETHIEQLLQENLAKNQNIEKLTQQLLENNSKISLQVAESDNSNVEATQESTLYRITPKGIPAGSTLMIFGYLLPSEYAVLKFMGIMIITIGFYVVVKTIEEKSNIFSSNAKDEFSNLKDSLKNCKDTFFNKTDALILSRVQ